MEQTVVRIRTLEIGSGMPKICVPVVGKTEKEILEGAERAKAAKPDLVEFRVDWYEEAADSKKVVALLEKLRKCLGELPVLFTFRSSREGGEAALSDRAYQSLNEAAIASGFVDCVDVELFSGDAVVKAVVAAAHSNNVKVIASNHDFEKNTGSRRTPCQTSENGSTWRRYSKDCRYATKQQGCFNTAYGNGKLEGNREDTCYYHVYGRRGLNQPSLRRNLWFGSYLWRSRKEQRTGTDRCRRTAADIGNHTSE